METLQRQKELEALETIRMAHNGILRPHDVVETARARDHILHGKFEWDDTEAAHQYRLFQARRFITVYVKMLIEVPDESVQVYVSLREDQERPGGGYRIIEDVLSDPDMRAMLLNEAKGAFRRMKAKYGRLKELAAVFTEIDKL